MGRNRGLGFSSLALLIGALLLALLGPSAGAAGPLEGRIICLDPGHPSDQGNGARGPSGYKEVAANWQVALKLKGLLAAAGAEVVLTKQSEGESVSDRKRADIANRAPADLMLRLHCDPASGSGFSIYYPDRRGTLRGISGPSLKTIEGSHAAALAIYPAMKSALVGSLAPLGLEGDSQTAIGRRQGALTASILSEVPVLAVEMAVMTSAKDERFIRSEAGQKKMAQALRDGVVAYLGRNEAQTPGAGAIPATSNAPAPASGNTSIPAAQPPKPAKPSPAAAGHGGGSQGGATPEVTVPFWGNMSVQIPMVLVVGIAAGCVVWLFIRDSIVHHHEVEAAANPPGEAGSTGADKTDQQGQEGDRRT